MNSYRCSDGGHQTKTPPAPGAFSFGYRPQVAYFRRRRRINAPANPAARRATVAGSDTILLALSATSYCSKNNGVDTLNDNSPPRGTNPVKCSALPLAVVSEMGVPKVAAPKARAPSTLNLVGSKLSAKSNRSPGFSPV